MSGWLSKRMSGWYWCLLTVDACSEFVRGAAARHILALVDLWTPHKRELTRLFNIGAKGLNVPSIFVACPPSHNNITFIVRSPRIFPHPPHSTHLGKDLSTVQCTQGVCSSGSRLVSTPAVRGNPRRTDTTLAPPVCETQSTCACRLVHTRRA